MEIPQVLGLPLEEASHRLLVAGFTYEVQLLLPPREEKKDFNEQTVRKYVVRQQKLSANRLALTIVYR